MDKNLQNIDNVFNKAYQQFEEEPSGDTWNKLDAMLDKKDADKYKKRFIGWKRIAVLLLFLLSGFLIYETTRTVRRKTGNGIAEKKNNYNAATSKSRNSNNRIIINGNNVDPEKGNHMPADKTTGKNNRQNELAETAKSGNVVHGNQDRLLIIETLKQKNTRKNNLTIINAKPGFVKSKNNPANSESSKNVVVDVNNVPNTITSKTNNLSSSLMKEQTIVPGILSLNEFENRLTVPITLPGIRSSAVKQISFPDLLIAKATDIRKKKKTSLFSKPYWTLTPFASGNWEEYQLNNDVVDNTSNTQNEKEEISKREKHETSFSSGVLVTRQLTKRIGLKTGIIYANTAIAIAPQEMYAAVQSNGNIAYKYITSSGYGYVKPGFGLPPAIGDSIQSATAQHTLQTLNIPFMVSYTFNKKKLSIMPSAGITANFIIGAKVKTEVTDALNREFVTINGLDGMRTFYAGFIGDINLQYNYSNRWSFNLMPGFKYALTPITKSNVVKTYPYGFNVGAGITYKF
ncbi:MAG TPA: outer membrane beta-barrel protein [Chitinophagaceae bacterium]|nr:outer membrane beta-barrel protein [Chitinophagaceae bacterium]